ncbi:MAG TPA: protein kinase [Ktedonobacteraceae bacterium]|nr:protein kinase [Ktedonobacteraceae bacterium]
MRGIEGLTLGRYKLSQRIAQGGMAEVYLGFDRRVRRQVAVKVLYGRDESFVRRFEREALAVGALSHDHILPLYDFGEQRPWYYLIMPYVEGGTLRDYLLRRKRLNLEEAASFTDQIASALQYAHDQGVMHRDVKPSNILLRPDGYAYLVDFGLAKAMMGGEALTNSGAMVGTPEYMAPEQSNGVNDYRSDIYSLGVILYQMLTGRVPFTAESPVAISLKHIQTMPTPPREINGTIPESVEAVILKALAKDPKERYQEAQALSAAYWKALQLEQSRLRSGGTTLPLKLNEEPFRELDEADETIDLKDYAREIIRIPSALTRILPDAEKAFVNPPVTPLLIPLAEDSQPSQQYLAFNATKKRHSLRVSLIALLCLLLIASIVPLGMALQPQKSTPGKPQQQTQSVTPLNGVELTATASASAQLQLQATLAANARVQVTAGITSPIGTGQALYADALTSPGGGWIDDGSQCYFSTDGYHVQSYQQRTAAWCYSNQILVSNAVITAQAQLLQGDSYGIVFRLSPASDNFYLLEINSRGSYRFVRAMSDNPYNWLTLIDWTRSNAILSGYGHINTFLILANGAQFRFYINKQLIVTGFSDTAFASGLIGFFVGGDSPGGTEATFSNVGVFQS